jgi:hypothetical protein
MRLTLRPGSRTWQTQSGNFYSKPKTMPLYTVGSQSNLPQSVMDYLAHGASEGERTRSFSQRLASAATAASPKA